jgi:hypothetical protein
MHNYTIIEVFFTTGGFHQPCTVMLPRPYMLIKLLYRNVAKQSTGHMCVIQVGCGQYD